MINDVEKRLAEYRAKKAKKPIREELAQKPEVQNIIQVQPADKEDPEELEPLLEKELEYAAQEPEENNPTGVRHLLDKYSRQVNITLTVLKFLLWATLMTLFVEIEFGAVFFILSLFYVIYSNLRSGPKVKGEPSAYSVFNPNCEAIDGTLTAEQFERELILGPKAVH